MKFSLHRLACTTTTIVITVIILTHQVFAQGQYQDASRRILSASELAGKSKMELKIMRNEIFARYGYIFKTADMKAHFGSQSWYRPSKADVAGLLTPIEKQNIELIKQLEKNAPETSQPYTAPVTTTPVAYGQRFAFTSERRVEPRDLAGLSLRDLQIMRNEIFARYGYIFKTKEMKTYFEAQPWYRATSADVSMKLTPLEKQNIEIIQKAEKASTSAVGLVYGGRKVTSVEAAFDGDLMRGSGRGCAVISFDDKRSSWIVVPFYLSRLDANNSVEGSEEEDYDYNRKPEYTPQEILASIDQEGVRFSGRSILLSGSGKTPTLGGRAGGEGEISVAQLGQKYADLYSSEVYWGDFRLTVHNARTYSALICMPEGNTMGRYENQKIKKVLHVEKITSSREYYDGTKQIKQDNSYARGMWFIDDADQHQFISADRGFSYTPPTGKVVKYVTVGSDEFLLLVDREGKKEWYLFSGESPDGKVMPFSPQSLPVAATCEETSDFDEYCTYFTVVDGNELRHLYDFNHGLYSFPKGTKAVKLTKEEILSENILVRYSIPGKGKITFNPPDNVGVYEAHTDDNEPLSLDEFRQE